MDPSELGIALSDPRLNRTLAEKGRPGRSNAVLTHRCTVLTCSGRPRGVGEHEVPIGVDALAATPTAPRFDPCRTRLAVRAITATAVFAEAPELRRIVSVASRTW